MKHSDERRARNSAAHMGHVVSAETREKIAASLRGTVVPEERRARISAATKGRPKSDETRARMSAAMRGNHERRKITGECVYCFRPAKTYDHIIPRGRPGWDAPDNVVPCCQSCNTSKKNRTPEEWWDWLTSD